MGTARTAQNQRHYARHRTAVRARQQARRARPVAYVCGPMTNYPALNHPAFFEAENLLVAQGFRVINPARHDREIGLVPDSTVTDTSEEFYTTVLRWDIGKLLSEVDTVYVLPGWQRSRGCRAELAVARIIGLEVLYERR